MTLPEHSASSTEIVQNTDDMSPGTNNGQVTQSVSATMWDPLLTHQLRVLLHTDRLLSLQHRDQHRPDELKQYDSLSLALKVFDLIISHTGLGQDIDHNQAINELLPLLEAMDRAADIEPERERQRQMAERVLSTLYNQDEGRQPFKLTYTTFEQGTAVKRVLSVRLLEERYNVDGDPVLRLSNESANLLLNALTVDLEDAQAAAEAIIQSQLARGRIQEARASAQWAFQQSVRLREHIERRILDTRRDFQSVDWKEEMRHLLDEALIHVQSRCTVEASIIATAREQREQLVPGSEQAYQLSEIISLIDACSRQHLVLQQRLMQAPRIFFEEQERQIFAFRPLVTFPHPQNDILTPLLRLPRVEVIHTLDDIVSACFPAHPPGIFSLARYLDYLLKPRRELHTETVPIAQRDLVNEDYDPIYFTPDIRQRAAKYLDTLEKPTRLSAIVQDAQAAGESIAVLEALVFLIMNYFDPRDSEKPDELPVSVLKTDKQQFLLNNIAGDDVLIIPKEEKHVI